jgi:hypothetical protein
MAFGISRKSTVAWLSDNPSITEITDGDISEDYSAAYQKYYTTCRNRKFTESDYKVKGVDEACSIENLSDLEVDTDRGQQKEDELRADIKSAIETAFAEYRDSPDNESFPDLETIVNNTVEELSSDFEESEYQGASFDCELNKISIDFDRASLGESSSTSECEVGVVDILDQKRRTVEGVLGVFGGGNTALD